MTILMRKIVKEFVIKNILVPLPCQLIYRNIEFMGLILLKIYSKLND
jgi:hypothetical protein